MSSTSSLSAKAMDFGYPSMLAQIWLYVLTVNPGSRSRRYTQGEDKHHGGDGEHIGEYSPPPTTTITHLSPTQH